MEDKVLTIDGREVSFRSGQTILEVARENQIDIPTLCHLKGTTPTGACRICVVEVAGARSLMTACSTPVVPNMVIQTESRRVVEARKMIIELLLAAGEHDCLLCPSCGDCRLQDLALKYQVTPNRFGRRTDFRQTEINPLIVRDFSRCILCGRCVQACNEVQGNRAISFGYRGNGAKIIAAGDRPLKDSECVFCGECVQACPTGALSEEKARKVWRPWKERARVRTTCTYCGVGCQMWLHVMDGRIVKVTGVEGALPNDGRLCVKGRFGYDFIYSEERLKTPLIRENGQFREASWDEALDLVSAKFKEIIGREGPDAIAGVSCARSINEDSYQMQKLFRAVIGTNNIDNCARTCHAPSVSGLAMSFGSGAMTNSITDFAKARMIFVIGSNMTEAHPVIATYVKNAVMKGAKLYVADPRRTALAEMADMFLPIKVGSDIAFLNGLMNVLITEDLYDKEYVNSCCMGFEALKEKVLSYPPGKVSDICGVPAGTIRDLARRMAAVKPGMLAYTLGITEHTCGVYNVVSCANLQMLLGNVGFECGGVNALRGQNNVQGACDMGALPNVFPGYQKVGDPAAEAKFKAAWGVERLPGRVGLMIPEMIEGLHTGKIKAFYVFGENLANTEPDIHHVEKCLASAEFLVCQDNFENETTRFAHVVLPGAAWGEKDGTYVNCERRVSRVRAVSRPPGVSKPDWWIFKEIARRMGHAWESDSAQELWDNEISKLAPQLTGIKYHRIEGDGLQWPVPDESHCGTPTLHKDGCFTCGLGQLIPVDWTPPAEVPDEAYPFVLSTGRRLYHYHTRTQTGRAKGLNDLLGEETADMSPVDGKALGIGDGEMIRVKSRRGEVVVKARLTGQVLPGMVWMAFHFRETCANWLTNPVFDPISQTAEYKACAVAVEKI